MSGRIFTDTQNEAQMLRDIARKYDGKPSWYAAPMMALEICRVRALAQKQEHNAALNWGSILPRQSTSLIIALALACLLTSTADAQIFRRRASACANGQCGVTQVKENVPTIREQIDEDNRAGLAETEHAKKDACTCQSGGQCICAVGNCDCAAQAGSSGDNRFLSLSDGPVRRAVRARPLRRLIGRFRGCGG